MKREQMKKNKLTKEDVKKAAEDVFKDIEKKERDNITMKDVLSFLEGNFKYHKDKLIGLEPHIKEQVEYRANICKEDCMKADACMYCGCEAKKIIYNKESCNGGARFPDLMDEEAWEEFKQIEGLDGRENED